MTISLRDVGSGYKRTSINANFTDIENEINNNLLSKNGGIGLEADLDANSQKIINLADGVNPSDAVNLGQVLAGATYSVTSSDVKFYDTVTLAENDNTLEEDDILILKDRATSVWDVVLTSTVTPDGYRIVQSVAIPTLSFVLRVDKEVNVLEFGADKTGATDSLAAFNAALTQSQDNNGRLILPAGLYYLSGPLTTSATETDALIIQGDGMGQTCIMVRGTDGVQLLGGQQRIMDLTIIDGDSYTTLPSTIDDAVSGDNIARANITANTVGLNLDRSDQRVDNVQVMGFDEGFLHTNTKFYTLIMKSIARKNLKGHVSGSTDLEDAPNFCWSIGCRYSGNYEMNAYVRTGFHTYKEPSFEACEDFDPDHPNFPDGGVYVGPLGHAVLLEPYFEDCNFYSANPRSVVRDFANTFSSNLFFAPIDINRTQLGAKSLNLIKPPHLWPWEPVTSGAMTVNTNVANVNSNKRYARVTVTGGAGVSKVLAAEWNTKVRGLQPREKGAEFRIKWGVWVRYVTDNFATDKPEINLRVRDINGGDYQIADTAKMNIFGNGDYGETKVNALGYSGTINSVVVDTGSNPRNTDITSTSASFLSQVKPGMFIVNTTAGAREGAKAIIKKVTSNSVINVDGDSFQAGDTFTIESWQYIGGMHSVQNDLVTGDALESIRMQITVEAAASDASSSNRILDISEPEISFMYAESQGHDMYLEAPDNLSHVNVSNPPTDAELDAAFGTPRQAGAGFNILINDNGADTNYYRVSSDGTSWWYDTLTKAT